MASRNESRLVASLQQKFDGLTKSPSASSLIRVPHHLRSLDEDGYTPRVVSIGPFHHGKQGLRDFEEEKLRCVQAFLSYSWSGHNLESLVRQIAEKKDRLKSFYAPGTYGNFDGDSLLELIVVDATFIVAIMLGNCGSNLFPAGFECLFRRTYSDSIIRRDLALLENQVPLFILIDLYDMIKVSWKGVKWSFCKLAITFFQFSNLSQTELAVDYVPTGEGEVRHLVDLLRRYHHPSEPRMVPRGNEYSEIPFRSLTELYECGVKLKLSTSKDALDIRYTINNGTLEIPRIKCRLYIMSMLENMVSFEQCYCKGKRHVTDYVNLMANLVRSPNDVELLLRHGILAGWVNQDICKFFYDLGRESLSDNDDFYYRRLCEELDDYCRVPWHMWRASLRHEYFKNPFAVVAACLYFLMALLDLLGIDKRGWAATFTTFCCLGLGLIAHLYA